MRSLMGGLVALTVVVSLLPVGAGATGTFGDADGNVHESAIEKIAALGITRGCNPPRNDLYCPGNHVTRGQMAAFLVRTFDLSATGAIFTDTGASVFATDIDRLATAGITRGCNPPTNDQFCPDELVTRGQMAAFLVRALDLEDPSAIAFSDTDGHVFEDDISRLAAAGITRGCNPPSNDRFCPDEPVRRDEMATFLSRTYDIHVTGSTTTSSSSTTSSSTTSITTPVTSSSTSTSTSTTTTTTLPGQSGDFIEQEGVVAMEVESVAPANGWVLESAHSGHFGDGYFRNDAPSTGSAGQGTLVYAFYITEPGNYAVAIRARRQGGEGVENDQRNDVFVRLDGSDWAKATHHTPFDQWGFIDKRREVEGDHETPFVALLWDLEIGSHSFQVSRRSDEVIIDRILIYRTDAAPGNLPAVRDDRPDASTPESPRKP
jgi:hypothetical protein